MNEFLSFGYWVRRRRKALDLTQTDLARMVFCSTSTIKKIELDQRHPSPLMAERLADCLQVQGADRQVFLAVAGAELSFDRLGSSGAAFIPKQTFSNISAYQHLTPFIGYQAELEAVINLIQQENCHLITLVGPGGIGKTRLALQVCSNQLQEFPGGVYFISLAQIDNSTYIPSAILDALPLPKHAISNPKTSLLDYLHDKAILIVLDNYEHLLNGIDLVIEVIKAAPSVVLLVTSRIPLNLRMERVFELKGMTISPGEGVVSPESYAAVQLFIQTAQRVGGDISLSRENLDIIIRICKLVDGLPLAIEIAASWSRLRSLMEIELGIKDSIKFLTSTMADVPQRHRSIEAAFEFSWRILSLEEKRVFPILSIFRGGFTSHAIRTIAKADQETLGSLVSKSLLRRVAPDRYDMYELLRRYSESKLIELDNFRQFKDLHLTYYLNLAELSFSDTQARPMAEGDLSIEWEIDNFRVALQVAIDNRIQERGLRLVIALGAYWHENGHLLEGMSWLTQMLQIEDNHFPALRGKALVQSAMIAQDLGDFDRAILLCKECLSLSEKLKDQRGIGLSLMIMGTVHYLAGESERGLRALKKSLSIFEQMGDEKSQALAHIRIADAERWLGKLDQASEEFQLGLLISSKLDNKFQMSFSLGGLGDIRRFQGKYQEAFEFYKKSLKINWEEKHKLAIPFVLEAMAMDYAALGLLDRALLLLAAAESLRDEIHSLLPPSYRRSYAPVIEKIHNLLGEDQFSRVWQEGRTVSLDVLVSQTLNLSSVL